jgi:RNA polymerase sigma factor (sigma-70 family)
VSGNQVASDQVVVVGDIPQEPSGLQVRPDLLAKLDQPGHRVQVLNGIPGAGSTQLAAAYARAKLAQGWRLVAWVNAENTGNLLAGLTMAADAVGLSDVGSGRDAADAGRAVRHWLEADGDRRLLVFDDAEDPDMLRPFVPAGGCRVLITSSRQPSANLGASVSVGVFSADEALAFLTGRAGPADAEGAAAVAAELGRLPLPLAQAAAVIAGQRLAYGEYLDRLRALPVEEYLTREEGQAYPHGVAEAVLLSLQAVQAADRAGVCTRVLEIMAVLSAAGVRRDLLDAAGYVGVLADGGQRVAAAQVDRALEWLSDQSLLTFSMDGRTVIMHRLVARVIRERLARRERLTAVCWAAASALDAYAQALAESPHRPAVRTVPVQVTALLDNTAGRAGQADGELALVLLRLRFFALYYLVELGDSTLQAIAVGEPLTADLERLLGPDHPETLNARNSLAAAYEAAGRVAEAIALFEQILAVRQRQLGPDHPGNLTLQNNLATAYQDAGRVAEAIPLFERILAVRQRLLGPGHPSTLNSRGNLATAYRDAGRVAEAIPLFEQTLAGRERALGPDHPDTRTSRKNLAHAYRDAGRVAEAIPLSEQTLAGRERALGPERPDTRTSRKNLAYADRDAGRVAEALPPAEQAPAAPETWPSADEAGRAAPAGFRRPPADPARRGLPASFRRPPADPARRLLPDGVARPSTGLTNNSSRGRAQDLPPKAVYPDREVVAAIAAGDPAGIAAAYDRYAAALYGYCQWMLPAPAAAAQALRDTFVIAADTLGDLPEAPELRPWLYAVARDECQRQRRTTVPARGDQADPADPPTGVGYDPGQAELRTLICAILAELKPGEREVIELSFRHDLYDSDLAEALGVSWSRAHALASRARGQLEKALGALLVARTGREACPELDMLLAGWDGRLTEQTRDLVGGHIEQCQACAAHGRGALRPAALSGLLPLPPLPPELREQILELCSSTTADALAYRRRVARRAESIWLARFSQAIRSLRWDSIRANPGPAAATLAVALWGAAALSVTLLIFAGSHPAHALAPRPSARTSWNSPAAAAVPMTAPAPASALAPRPSARTSWNSPAAAAVPTTAPAPASASPSPAISLSPAYEPPSTVPSASPTIPTEPSPSLAPSYSAMPSKSPTPSKSPSLSPSHSGSPSHSPSRTTSTSISPLPSPSKTP